MGNEAETRLALARAGDREARDGLIRAYTPFVLRVASRACGRYLVTGRDDEVSVALIAFNEAIDRFDGEAGSSFLAFAEMVIRRRLIDHYRASRNPRETPLTEFESTDDEGQPFNVVDIRGALAKHEAEEQAQRRRADIERFREVLAEFGLTLQDLVDAAPRHEDARRRAMAVARRIAETPAFVQHLKRHKALPLKELSSLRDLGVSRKTLERQRKYIIAVAMILLEDLETLREYIKA
ncbi:MAG: RNA polymerase sigma-I factor [Clostridia bacterium]|nr:RNA polymerase sigma-I factor [Clostridia bacterium]